MKLGDLGSSNNGSSGGGGGGGGAPNMASLFIMNPPPRLPGLMLPPSGEANHPRVASLPRSSSINEDERESKSGGSDGGSAGDEEQDPSSRRKRRNHRHTPYQIQQLEMFFKSCPHPDENQRKSLGEMLTLTPRQVKFWFQNRRTQLKGQQERQDNAHFRAENERLRAENIAMREAIKNVSCPSCGGPSTFDDMAFDEQYQLRIENARLRDELDRVSAMAGRYFGRTPAPPLVLPPLLASATSPSSLANSGIPLSGPSVADIALRPGSTLTEWEKAMVAELAVTSWEELVRMAHAEEPLWVKNNNNNVLSQEGGDAEVLNCDEYFNQFPRGIGPRHLGLKIEASRESGVAIINGIALVDSLMDADKWQQMFPTLVSRAVTVEVLCPGSPTTRDGALQLMYAETQMLSPLVPTREAYFLRFCKQALNKTWAVVDVSIDCLKDNPPPSLLCCRRRPSGCLIKDLLNGYAQVTWVEHCEVDNNCINTRIFHPLVSSGRAFGAKRWLAALKRHCESLVSLLATNIPVQEMGVMQSPEGRRSILGYAQKMMQSFCANMAASSINSWLTLPKSGDEEEEFRVMMSERPGEGILLCAATSVWLPFARQHVFDFLRTTELRGEWDLLASGPVQERSHIAKGPHPGNNVSLLRLNATDPSQGNRFLLQESCTDAWGSLLVYTPIDLQQLSALLQGSENPNFSTLMLPSGLVVVPDSTLDGSASNEGGEEGNGSILTVSLQIAISHIPFLGKLDMDSVNTVRTTIIKTVHNIKLGLQRTNNSRPNTLPTCF